MKRKTLSLWIVLLGIAFAGCGVDATEEETNEYKGETVFYEESEAEQESLTEPEEQSTTEEVDLTFEDLSKLQFYFSSGAGGWGEEFTIEKDGYFTGNYHDSDMGVTGEGYENGSRYSSTYSGHFTDLVKVDDYTYKMTLSDITYKEEPGTEEIWDGIRYIYTDAYCLGGNDTFYVYLPGTPVSHFSEEVWIWLRYDNESETELTMTVIVDEKNGYGIVSYERMAPVEDARMTYNSYKESYDYYVQMASEGETTLEIRQAAGAMYEVSDECLNYLWNIIRYNVEEEKFEEILAQQRQWNEEKETAAEEAEEEWGGGTFAPIMYLDTKAEMTIKRCEELLQYIEENVK